MAIVHHVAGPIVPQCNIGTLNAFVAIGECAEGAMIEVTPIQHEVRSDAGGGQDGGPVEIAALNAIATIRFRLVPFDGTYVTKLRALSIGSATDGSPPTPGTLLGKNSLLPALYLPGVIDEPDGPWYFPTCRITRPGSSQPSTKPTTPEWEFRAMVYVDPSAASSVSGLFLYKRTAPP